MGKKSDLSTKAQPSKSPQLMELLGLLLDGSSALVGLKDLDGRYVFANRELETVFGRMAKPLTGLSDQDLLTKALADDFEAKDRAVAASGRPSRSIEEFAPDLRQAFATVRFPYRNETNDVVGTGFVAIAISEPGHWDPDAAAMIDSAQRTIEELKRAVEDMRLRATTDPLTGAWNRARIDECGQQEVQRLARYGHPVSLVFVDIDHFKTVNDVHGHAAGDDVLRGFCAIAQRCMRSLDQLGRWGGEEFLIILPNSGLPIAQLLAERIRVALMNHDFSPTGPITASFGIAECQADESMESWLARADAALYAAKEAGRNRVVAASPLLPNAAESDAEQFGAGFLRLVWRPNYHSGHKLIDHQHRALFDDANILLTAMIGGRPKGTVMPLLEALLADIAVHFHDEEEILAAIPYAGAGTHKETHARLVTQAGDMAERYARGALSVGELFNFVAYELVAQHLLTEDRKFFPDL